MSFYSKPGQAIETLTVQVMTGGVRWVFQLSGVKSFVEIAAVYPLPPPAAWDGLIRIDGAAYCLRMLKEPGRSSMPAAPFKGCLIERGRIPVVLGFEKFVTGRGPEEFQPLPEGSAPFPGVTGRTTLSGGSCYRIDTGKLIV